MLPFFQREGMSEKAKTLQISLHLVSVNFCLAVTVAYSVNCHSHYCIRCWWCLLTLWGALHVLYHRIQLSFYGDLTEPH